VICAGSKVCLKEEKKVTVTASSSLGSVSYIQTSGLGNAGKVCGRVGFFGETEIRLDKVGMVLRLARCQRRQAD
jgi:hypothetical protein